MGRHSPGLELDVLIAEKVMGWRGDIPYDGTVNTLRPPHYSTEIAAAFEVSAKIYADYEYWLELTIIGAEYSNAEFLWDHDGPLKKPPSHWTKAKVEEDGDSPAHAICLAALKVIETSMEPSA